MVMAESRDKLDRIVAQARRDAEAREAGYRARALKLFPWVCGVCARSFTQANLQLLEVHHKNGNHDDNPPDGSNWELLCTYCHEHEHSKLRDAAGRTDTREENAPATHKAFADLANKLTTKRSGK